MNEARLETIEQIREFLAGTTDVAFGALTDESSLHTFVATVLKRFNYFHLSKGPRGVVFTYMQILTRYSRQHLSRLIARYRHTKALHPIRRANRTSYARKYGPEDVALLAELDSLHDTLSGPATKVLLMRAHRHFGDARYTRLAGISVAHLYNLWASTGYRKQRRVWTHTRPTPLRIGVRRAPAPNGLPGYIRIDTVHQGNQDGIQGRLSHQRDRYRHPVATRGRRGAHQCADLQQCANAMSDNDAAKHLQQTRKLLFQSFTRRSKTAA